MMKSRTSTQTPNNRVLAIDPGFDRVGVAVMEKLGGKEIVIYSNCIETNRKATTAERLQTIGDSIRETISEFSPTELAIEKLFFNQNITTALRVAEARGVILCEAARGKLEVFEYSPQAVKLAVTGYGKASKPDVKRLLTRLLVFIPKSKHDDEMDAVAMGITHLASRKGIWYK